MTKKQEDLCKKFFNLVDVLKKEKIEIKDKETLKIYISSSASYSVTREDIYE